MQYLMIILGGFILPFSILCIWGKLVNRFGALGGWLGAFMIIGPVWFVNHGMPLPFIHQSSKVFIDMGFSTAIGVFVYGLRRGIPLDYHRSNILAAIFGGMVAGVIIATVIL